MSWGEEPHRRKGLHDLKPAGFGACLMWRAEGLSGVLSQDKGCAVSAWGVRQKSFLLGAQGDPWYLQAQVREAKEFAWPMSGFSRVCCCPASLSTQRDDTHALWITSLVNKAWSRSLSKSGSFMRHKGRQVHCFFFHLLSCCAFQLGLIYLHKNDI